MIGCAAASVCGESANLFMESMPIVNCHSIGDFLAETHRVSFKVAIAKILSKVLPSLSESFSPLTERFLREAGKFLSTSNKQRAFCHAFVNLNFGHSRSNLMSPYPVLCLF